MEKIKPNEIRFDKTLQRKATEDLSIAFRFDILAQLTNILAGIIMHELLHLYRKTRDTLRDALVDNESFLAQIPSPKEEEYQHCHYYQASALPNKNFSLEDMLVKGPSHDRPLYYTVSANRSKLGFYYHAIQFDAIFTHCH